MIAERRLPDWPERFQAFVAQRQRTPFGWGVNDCCLFAADCALAVTGTDPARALRGTYRGARQAARLVAAMGGIGALAARFLGPEIPPTLALRGDIGLVAHQEGGPLLAVNNGPQWIAPTAQGIEVVGPAIRAWRVCRG